MAQESAPEVDERSALGPAAEQPSNKTRRGLLVGAGLVGVAGIVAACGGDDEEPTTGGGGGDTGGGSPADSGGGGGAAVAKTSEIPVGGGKIIAAEKMVITQPAQGDYKAFSNVCTHRGCPVESISNGLIGCPCHGSKFKIADGSVANGPATKPLESKSIKVEGDNITLA